MFLPDLYPKWRKTLLEAFAITYPKGRCSRLKLQKPEVRKRTWYSWTPEPKFRTKVEILTQEASKILVIFRSPLEVIRQQNNNVSRLGSFRIFLSISGILENFQVEKFRKIDGSRRPPGRFWCFKAWIRPWWTPLEYIPILIWLWAIEKA